jgi:hypothetical protein
MEEKTEEKKIFTEKICNTCGGKKSKQDINLDIYPKQKAFLQSITKSYDVKDEDVSALFRPHCRAAPVPRHCTSSSS